MIEAAVPATQARGSPPDGRGSRGEPIDSALERLVGQAVSSDSHLDGAGRPPEGPTDPHGEPPAAGYVMSPEDLGDGEWMLLTEAQPLLRIPSKTLYRHADTGKRKSREEIRDGKVRRMVWVTADELRAGGRRPPLEPLQPITPSVDVTLRGLVVPIIEELATTREQHAELSKQLGSAEAQATLLAAENVELKRKLDALEGKLDAERVERLAERALEVERLRARSWWSRLFGGPR